MEGKEKISVDAVGKMLGVTGRQIRRYIHEGSLRADKQGKAFLIDYDSVLAFQKNKLPSGSDVDTIRGEEANKATSVNTGMSDVQDNKTGVPKMSTENKPVSDIEHGLEDMDSLKRRLRLEQERSKQNQLIIEDLRNQLRVSLDNLRKSNARRLHDRRLLNWILVSSLLSLFMLFVVLFSILG